MSQPPKQLKDSIWLFNQYVTQNKSASQIGRELKCQQETVSKYLHKYGISIRPPGTDVTGEKSGLWGKSVPKSRKDHIREGVIASYESGENERWTPEKREEQSKRMTGIGNFNYGRITPEEQKERQKATLAKTLTNDPSIQERISKGKKEYHKTHPSSAGAGGNGEWIINPNSEKEIYLRGPYEIRVANILNHYKIIWDYECIPFDVQELGTYWPDFYLPEYNLWWEVKGWMTESAKNKIRKFYELYPDINLKIIRYFDIGPMECLITNGTSIDVFIIGSDDININNNTTSGHSKWK